MANGTNDDNKYSNNKNLNSNSTSKQMEALDSTNDDVIMIMSLKHGNNKGGVSMNSGITNNSLNATNQVNQT